MPTFFLTKYWQNKIVTKEPLEQKICNTCRLKLLKLSMKKDEGRKSDQEVRLLFYFIVTFWIELFSKKFSYKKILFFSSSNILVNKGFSNRDITILSMNKTQKYLRYWVQIYCGCSASITFYEWNSIWVVWPLRARLQRSILWT